MNPFSLLEGPAILGQKAAINPFMNLRNMMLLQREDRYDTPRPARMGRQSSGGGFMSGGGMSGGGADYSAYTFNPQMNAQARAIGINPLAPNQVNPYAFLPGNGFFGAHPHLANALEGGLFGAAATQGANTWGEGVSNVARGLLQGRMDRSAMYQRQFQIPFENFAQMEKLKGLGIEDQLHEAMIQHYRAQTDALNNKPDPDPHLNVSGGVATWWNRATDRPESAPIPGYQNKEHDTQWTDYRDDYLKNHSGSTIEQASEAYDNRKIPKPPAPDKGGPWIKRDGKYVRVTSGMSAMPGDQTVGDVSRSSEPTMQGQALKDQLKKLESDDSRGRIFDELLKKARQAKGKNFSYMNDSPSEADIDAEVKSRQDALIKSQTPGSPMPQTNNTAPAPAKPKTVKFTEGGRTYNIPENMVNDFKRDHPNAR